MFKDLEFSTLFPGQQVSYEACYSPSIHSSECNQGPQYRQEQQCRQELVDGVYETRCFSSVTVPSSGRCRRLKLKGDEGAKIQIWAPKPKFGGKMGPIPNFAPRSKLGHGPRI